MTSYYEKNKNHYMKKLKEFAPEQFKAFSRFDGTVFKPGALTKKRKGNHCSRHCPCHKMSLLYRCSYKKSKDCRSMSRRTYRGNICCNGS